MKNADHRPPLASRLENLLTRLLRGYSWPGRSSPHVDFAVPSTTAEVPLDVSRLQTRSSSRRPQPPC